MALKPAYGGSSTSSEVADGSISTAKLADASVTAAKLADGAVTPEKLSGSATIETTDWSSLTDYEPNTIVKKSGVWYIHLGASVSTNEDPASGSPWVVFGSGSSGGSVSAGSIADVVRWYQDDFCGSPFFHEESAIASGTGSFTAASGYGALGLIGVRSFSSTASINSGRKVSSSSVASIEPCAGLRWFCTFQIPTALTEKTIIAGCHDSGGTSAPSDGVWLQIVDGTLSVLAANNNTPVAHGTTASLDADTWYNAWIFWTSTSSVHVVVEELDGTPVLDVTITTNLPAATRTFGSSLNAFANVAPASAAAIVLVHIDRIGFGIAPE